MAKMGDTMARSRSHSSRYLSSDLPEGSPSTSGSEPRGAASPQLPGHALNRSDRPAATFLVLTIDASRWPTGVVSKAVSSESYRRRQQSR